MGSRAGNRLVAAVAVPQSDGVWETESGWACSTHHRGTTMEYYAGIDVSLESASLCVVDATGRIVREAKVASEPDVLIGWFGGLDLENADSAGAGHEADTQEVRWTPNVGQPEPLLKV